MHRVLVVHFSRTGNTRSAAERIARSLGADVEEIRVRARGMSYWRAAIASILRVAPPIETPRHDPRDYDLVIVASPIWYLRVATPMRAYLRINSGRIARLATLLTCGGAGMVEVFAEIDRLAGTASIACTAVTERDRQSGDDVAKLAAFARDLAEAAAASRPAA